MTLQMGWFSTGRGQGSRGLLEVTLRAIQRGELDARIQFVFSNRDPGEHEGSDRYFALARQHGIPLVHCSSRRFRQRVGPVAENRDAYDAEVMKLLEGFSPDIIALAGYMLIVSAPLCQRYTMVNLHPALPHGPRGTWQEVIWQLIRQRAAEAGAMVHLVTESVDEGPPLTYFSFPLRGHPFDALRQALDADSRSLQEVQRAEGEEQPLFKAIREAERRREPYLLLETLKALADGRIRIRGRQVVDASGRPAAPRCLNAEVDAALGG